MLAGDLPGVFNHVRVMGGDGRPEAVAEKHTRQIAIVRVHVALFREGHRGGLTVGALDEPNLGAERLQALQILFAAVEVGLHGEAGVLVSAADGFEKIEGGVDRIGVLHIHLDEVVERLGVADDAQGEVAAEIGIEEQT